MDRLKIPSSEKIKSERPGLVKCLVTSLSLFVALSCTFSRAATDSATGITTPDINARSYGSKINRRSVSGRVYLFDILDATQELPQTGRLVLLRQAESPVMALRVLRQYPDKRQYAAKWLRRYSGTKDLEAGSQYITLEKVSDKETPPLSANDKKDLKELEAPATPPAPAPVTPVQAEAPPVVAPPVAAPAPAPIAPPAAVQAAPVAPPTVAQAPAPQVVAPVPEPPTAPLPAPPPVLAAPVTPPAQAPAPVAVATPEVPPAPPVAVATPEPQPATPVVMASPTQDVTAPPLAPEPTASDAAAPAPPVADAAPTPEPTPTDSAVPPPAAAVAQNDIPAPADNTPTPPAPKADAVPNTEGETADVSANPGDDMSNIMVEEMKVFDRDENSIGLGAGLYRNTLVSGGTISNGVSSGYSTTTIYSSGGTLRYSRTLKHMLNYKSKSLQDSFSVDASLGFYKYLGQSGSGDTYTIAPISATLRYTLLPSESFGVFIYGGVMKNFVAQAVNADPNTQAGFNSLFPEVGVGMLFQIGPSWYMRADLGWDLLGVSIALKF